MDGSETRGVIDKTQVLSTRVLQHQAQPKETHGMLLGYKPSSAAMKPCGATSAVLTAVAACVAYAVLFWGGQQQRSGSEGGGEYELGSGKMFDSIAPRYDLINKVWQQHGS